MNTKSSGKSKAATGRHGRWQLPTALLSVAAGLIGLAIIIAMDKPEPPAGSLPAGPKPITVEDVLAKARPLLDVESVPEAMARQALAQARDLMQAYVNSAPGDVHVRPLLAEAQLKLGELDAAAGTIGKLLTLSPEGAAGPWLKGQLLRRQGRGDSAECLEYFGLAAEATDAGPREWISFGLLAARTAKPYTAKVYLTRAVQAGAANRQALSVLGRIVLAEGRNKEAEDYFAEALKLTNAAQDASLWSGLAGAQLADGRPADAVETLRTATETLRRWKDKSAMMVELGGALDAAGQLEEAAQAYAAGSDGMPGLPSAALKAARCYWRLGRPALATKYIDRAAELRPDDSEIQLWKARIEDARLGPAEQGQQGRSIATEPAR